MQKRESPWVVAVSGGIDSVVLLDVLAGTERPLVVGHVNHGLRPDSSRDTELVASLAERYGVPYDSVELHLAVGTSEERARVARHKWLEEVRQRHSASHIATAHHQDDVIETMMMNLLRGTGWRGLASLRPTSRIVRPLLDWSKADIVTYAIERGLTWREDSTNDDVRFRRNYLRHGVAGGLPAAHRHRLLSLARAQDRLRQEIEGEVEAVTAQWTNNAKLARYPLVMIADEVALEVLRQWLGANHPRPYLGRILRFARVARPGQKFSLDSSRYVIASRDELVVTPRED